MKTVVIAQARVGSSRLPGKVLKTLGGKSVIAQVLSRASRAQGVDEVCIATTTEPGDDAVASAGNALGYQVFRGSEPDVLSRYAGAAAMTNADIVVRITCDCPLIDPGVIGGAVRALSEKNAEYVAQEWLQWPQGVGCEVFPRALLDCAAASTSDPYDHEHVTPWIRNHGARALHWMPGPGGEVANQRWLLDYPEDYAFLEKVFALFPDAKPPDSWQAIWVILKQHPEIYALNQHLRENIRPK